MKQDQLLEILVSTLCIILNLLYLLSEISIIVQSLILQLLVSLSVSLQLSFFVSKNLKRNSVKTCYYDDQNFFGKNLWKLNVLCVQSVQVIAMRAMI